MTNRLLRGPIERASASLARKLIAAFLLLGVTPMLVVGWFSFTTASQDLESAAGHRLEDAAATSGDMIDRNLFERYGDVQAFAANPDAQGSQRERQTIVDFLMANYGIYDLMLIVDLEGTVLSANAVDGAGEPIDNSRIIGREVSDEEWFRIVSSGDTPDGGTYYTDAHRSHLVEAMYGEDLLTLPFTAPIFDADGEMVAIWHNEASFERVVTDIMTQLVSAFAAQGLQTMETQVLRSDGVVLADADPSAVMELNLVSAGLEAAENAVGAPGTQGYTAEAHLRTGVEQINGWAVTDGALGFDGYGWGILVRQDASEATAPAAGLRNSMLVFALIIASVTAGVGFWLARGIARPLQRNLDGLEQVADGDLGVEFPVTSTDEIGQMSAAITTALESIGETLADVGRGGDELVVSAADLTGLSEELAVAASRTSDEANGVADAADEITKGTDSATAAIEQMTASVQDISSNTAAAAGMTAQAVEASTTTRHRIEKLDTSASDIGDVIEVITSIAEQTNLLALNATIEAARAGDAGKGFAVVAGEVKALAQQTAEATEQIEAKIETIQVDTASAVAAIGEISELIERVNEASSAIASAAEEQGATTAEVSNSIQFVADGAATISRRIGSVADAATTTKSGAAGAQVAASDLNALAERINGLLDQFTLSTSQCEFRATAAVEPVAAGTDDQEAPQPGAERGHRNDEAGSDVDEPIGGELHAGV